MPVATTMWLRRVACRGAYHTNSEPVGLWKTACKASKTGWPPVSEKWITLRRSESFEEFILMIHSGWTSSTSVGSSTSGTSWRTSSTLVESSAPSAGSATCFGSVAEASGFWGAAIVCATGSRSVADMVLAVAVGDTVARCNAAILDSCGFCFALCSLALASATTACVCVRVCERKCVDERK